MTEADFTGFERGVLGSTAENLSSLDYQIQKDIYTAYRKAGYSRKYYDAHGCRRPAQAREHQQKK